MTTMTTKTIALSFSIPADLDTPSEVLLDLRTLLLDALAEKLIRHLTGKSVPMSPERLAQCNFLLLES